MQRRAQTLSPPPPRTVEHAPCSLIISSLRSSPHIRFSPLSSLISHFASRTALLSSFVTRSRRENREEEREERSDEILGEQYRNSATRRPSRDGRDVQPGRTTHSVLPGMSLILQPSCRSLNDSWEHRFFYLKGFTQGVCTATCGKALPLFCISTAFVAKTLPLPCVFTVCLAQKLHHLSFFAFHCLSTVFQLGHHPARSVGIYSLSVSGRFLKGASQL